LILVGSHRRCGSPARFAWLIAALAAVLLSVLETQADDRSDGVHVAVETISLGFDVRAPATRRFGALEWRGGFEIVSDDRAFGGYSGLIVSSDGGRLLAVSDRGTWAGAELVYVDGQLADVANWRTAPMLGPSGAPFASSAQRDVEGLGPHTANRLDGMVLVALERAERILQYDLAGAGFAAVPREIALPAAASQAPFNKELEAVGMLPGDTAAGGTIIAISERYLDTSGNIIGWLISDAGPEAFSVERSGDFDITDLAVLPSGDIVILERRLSYLMFAGMRIRRIAGDDIGSGRTMTGSVLLEVDQPLYNIDNMEAIAVHRTDAGELRLTIMSDDNFNPLQRTLLMQFAVPQ
jgi:hypothetical protein